MLLKLNIRNYAIIDELSIGFSPQLNIITGETGAGKSILMGALSLILGERADTSYLQNREQKCVVEGIFLTGGRKDVAAFLENGDLDPSDELIIRREISTAGKSRAFINDTPVSLEQLRTLSAMMVDLHRQFDTLDIGKVDFQRSVLDAVAGNGVLKDAYMAQYAEWQATLRELNRLRKEQEQFNRDLDYHQFQFNELDEMNFRADELEETEAELKMLSQAEQLQGALAAVCYNLSESEQPIVQQLKQMLQQVQTYSDGYAPLKELVERLQSVHVELQDIAGEFDRLQDHIKHDPQRLAFLNERLAAGYRLQKKHGVNTTADLIAIKEELEKKLQASSENGDRITALEIKAAKEESALRGTGKKLSEKRQEAAGPFTKEVNTLLTQVGMPNALLKLSLTPCEPEPQGMDQVEFLFDANKSGRFEPVRKVASGGELSRLMLCIKSLVAGSMDLPTMIFDEIDTGISGEAAKQVGVILRKLATQRQVLCITHQPQIAGKAHAHYFVYKETRNNKVRTNIRLLGEEERVNAIAQMLSGETPTAAALENARELVNS
ncbi:DNA repair protein RecN [Parasegetibacter sp. NRK P23]|uniref:DNA repair protein RecN n=1 Tax=Parasegetibacter sp. NRK P23 TaxID=2942999 RepID=UPI002043288A|nr:DNA repair protein RecN [Parasegetibacter sp. NRK P23]MCM5529035.1 DNA repair protein RecN [Parasegetibacter sp. NRK P23]